MRRATDKSLAPWRAISRAAAARSPRPAPATSSASGSSMLERVVTRWIHCAGGILGRGQEKGAARIGNTGKPFDDPTTQKTPALSGCVAAGAPGHATPGREDT